VTFFLTFIFMLLVFWRPQDWLVQQLQGVPILDAVVAVAMLSLLIEIDAKRIRYPRQLPQMKLVPFLLFAALMSHAVHTYFVGMVDTFLPVFKFCFFTVLLFVVMDSPDKLRWVARLFVAMAIVMGIHCLLQEHTGKGFGYGVPLKVPAIGERAAHVRTRFYGIFEDPNDAGQFLVTAMPFAFLLFRKRTFKSSFIGLAICAFLFFPVLSTHSRGALVGFAAFLAMAVFIRFPPRTIPFWAVVGLLGALPLAVLYGASLDMSARERVVIWGYANQTIAASPIKLLFGIGYNMFWQLTTASTGFRGLSAHNMFVFCYTQLGYFGFIFWFGLIVTGLMGAWRVRMYLRPYRQEHPDYDYLWRYAGWAIAAMGSFCASGYFLSRAFVYPFFFMVAILGVLPMVTQEWYNYGLPEDEQIWLIDHPRTVWSLCPLAAGLGMVYVWLSCIALNLLW
jgi:putative inorganic carbon (HCO3(-)) transporter